MARIVSSGLTAGGAAGGVISVQGVPQAIAKFSEVASIAGRQMGFITYAAAQAIEQSAKAIVPVVTGHLRDGIQTNKLGLYTWEVAASSLAGGADKEYAPFVEYGTSKMSPRPYLRPAFKAGVTAANVQLKLLALQLEKL